MRCQAYGDAGVLMSEGAEQQPGESREDWKLRTFALHYGAGLPKIEEMLAKREI